jgi:FkbM family methyltransferase
MTFRRRVIRALDRPGGRAILGRAVTQLARKSVPDIRVYFSNGMWMHESRAAIFVDSRTLEYHPPTFRTWINECERCRADARDHWFHAYTPHDGDLIVDVGAGKGEDVIAFSEAAGRGRVIAIEAHPATYRCLQLFCALNHLRNVTTLHYAVSDRPGAVAIGSAEGWQANSLGTGGSGPFTVPGTTLDEIVETERIERIDFLKMNIEGAERSALEGMSKTLGITRALCIACHDFRADGGDGEYFRTRTFVESGLTAAGFRLVSREGDPRPYIRDQVNAVRSADQ